LQNPSIKRHIKNNVLNLFCLTDYLLNMVIVLLNLLKDNRTGRPQAAGFLKEVRAFEKVGTAVPCGVFLLVGRFLF